MADALVVADLRHLVKRTTELVGQTFSITTPLVNLDIMELEQMELLIGGGEPDDMLLTGGVVG